MKYLITVFLLLFTINSSLSDEGLWQKLDAVGTCGSRENPTIYMQEKDCVKDHGTCAHLTVNCNYAKLATQEVDDLEKPIECEGQQLLANSTCYEKKTIYVTEIDGAKKLAYDAQVINNRLFEIQKQKAQCGHDVVLYVGAINQTKPNLTVAKVQEVVSRTKPVADYLKDGALELALVTSYQLSLDGTILDENDKLDIISKIQACIVRFQ